MLPDRLKNRRREKKFSQEDMGKALGITRQGYGHYESGRNEPDSATLLKLSEILDCSVDFLIGKSDTINEKSAEYTYDDPDFQLAMRSAQGFSDESKKKVLDFIGMLREVEEARENAKSRNKKKG